MAKALKLFLIIILAIGLVSGLVLYVGVRGFLFAWVLNFLLMMCVLWFTETLQSPLTSLYFNQKIWEQKGKLYEQLGVNFFRKILVWIGWEKLNKKANPVAKNKKALAHLAYRTKQSELGHGIIFIIVLAFAIYVAAKHGIIESLWLFLLNILLNLFPIYLQRYNRPRLERAIMLLNRP